MCHPLIFGWLLFLMRPDKAGSNECIVRRSEMRVAIAGSVPIFWRGPLRLAVWGTNQSTKSRDRRHLCQRRHARIGGRSHQSSANKVNRTAAATSAAPISQRGAQQSTYSSTRRVVIEKNAPRRHAFMWIAALASCGLPACKTEKARDEDMYQAPHWHRVAGSVRQIACRDAPRLSWSQRTLVHIPTNVAFVLGQRCAEARRSFWERGAAGKKKFTRWSC
jgi:hypothetical protein